MNENDTATSFFKSAAATSHESDPCDSDSNAAISVAAPSGADGNGPPRSVGAAEVSVQGRSKPIYNPPTPDLDLPPPALRERIEARLERRSIPEPNTGCLLWMGARDAHGYGQLRVGLPVRQTHRVAYSLAFGLIPDGLHIDHRCGQKACLNPLHLEPVTSAENTRRAARRNRRPDFDTHCARGHSYAVVGVYVLKHPPGIVCRTCWAVNQAQSSIRRGATKTTRVARDHIPTITPSKRWRSA